MPFVRRRYAEAESDAARERFEGYLRPVPCPVCQGKRLKPSHSAVTVAARSIAEVAAMPIGECANFLASLDAHRPRQPRSGSGCSKKSMNGWASWSTSGCTT